MITQVDNFKHLLIDAETIAFEAMIQNSEDRLRALKEEIGRAEVVHGKWLTAISVSRSVAHQVSIEIVESKTQLNELNTKLNQVRDILRGLSA